MGQALGLTRRLVARGAAYADIDHDGWLDVLLTTNGGPAYLYRNNGGNPNRAIRIKTVGTRSNREAWQTVRSGSSYCSSSELILTFGLGNAALAESVEIIWPSGQRDTLRILRDSRTYTVEEGGKILAARPFAP